MFAAHQHTDLVRLRFRCTQQAAVLWICCGWASHQCRSSFRSQEVDWLQRVCVFSCLSSRLRVFSSLHARRSHHVWVQRELQQLLCESKLTCQPSPSHSRVCKFCRCLDLFQFNKGMVPLSSLGHEEEDVNENYVFMSTAPSDPPVAPRYVSANYNIFLLFQKKSVKP